MAVSKRLRYEVMRRDNFTCRYCGSRADRTTLTVDHVVPLALGGDDEPGNLVTACADCNAGKSSSSPDQPIVENVADDALRWSRAMKRAASIEQTERERLQPVVAAVDEAWCDWKTQDGEGEPLPRPVDWKQTVERLHAAGLTVEDMRDAIEITMTAKGVYNTNLWRYFCGVGWNKLRQRQEIARALIEAEEGDE